ncbi:hypothetical protein [Streptomyces noursei]|uniref:hypothetical protein n=1 Tax=Streptomyces noursei TaxID=1971 RepID=UPI0015E15219|nr:hypothetical protein [Streptomyces noursei]
MPKLWSPSPARCLVIAWHLINSPGASYQELGADWHLRRLNPACRTCNLVS